MNGVAILALWAAVIVVASNCGALRLPDVGHTLSLPSTAISEARLAHKSRSHASFSVLMQVSLESQGFADFANFGGCRLPDSDFLEGTYQLILVFVFWFENMCCKPTTVSVFHRRTSHQSQAS